METIGVLGIIGTRWATRYQAAGKLAGVWNRMPKPEAPAWKAAAREVTEAADITHIVVAEAVIDLIRRAQHQ
jgi:3-hydroxyisobutyrate dehydrogenase-like beta-hydroxyacid dehydrogenase